MAKKNLLLATVIEGILDKKGQEIVDIDLTKIHSALCDHFVVCHAESNTQVLAIADSVQSKVKEALRINIGHREGLENATWVLLDFYDVVVHIFQRETRQYYQLEELWGDAQQNRIEESYS